MCSCAVPWEKWWQVAGVAMPAERVTGAEPGPGPGSGPDAPPAASPGVAAVDSDSVFAGAIDHLDVEPEARAFARVAASRGVVPPLSIGVFGEWGSGKTFFMEKMHDHVERLQLAAAAAVRDGKPTAFHTRIVQIRFNAWHYMETNLWASLVDHIFRELDKWLRPKQDAEHIDALFERLSTARTLRLEALERAPGAAKRPPSSKRPGANWRPWNRGSNPCPWSASGARSPIP